MIRFAKGEVSFDEWALPLEIYKQGKSLWFRVLVFEFGILWGKRYDENAYLLMSQKIISQARAGRFYGWSSMTASDWERIKNLQRIYLGE